MIHQFIFAGPKPGLPEHAFQAYWLHFHAVDFARRIPQIRRYLVAVRLPVKTGCDVPFFGGVAEIWLQNEAEQLASLQSPEFLNGARADEPRWTAFWQTLALDTVSQAVVDATGVTACGKIYTLLKRRTDQPLDTFRDMLLEKVQAERPRGLCQRELALCSDALYGLGEPRFDAIDVQSFEDEPALYQACAKGTAEQNLSPYGDLIDPRYVFRMAAREHWIIRPGERDSSSTKTP